MANIGEARGERGKGPLRFSEKRSAVSFYGPPSSFATLGHFAAEVTSVTYLQQIIIQFAIIVVPSCS